MTDTLQRFGFDRAPVRGGIAQLEASWRAVLERHDYPPALQSLLGESMAAAALLAGTLDFDGTMTMQMQGPGPVRLLVVECTSDFTLRATAKWDGEPQPGPLDRLLGGGRFVITLVPRSGTQSYQGVVDLTGSSLTEALQHYMLHSEQLDTRFWLAAGRERAGGMLLQKLPDARPLDADAWQRATLLGATLTADELLALPAITLLRRLFHQETVRAFDSQPLVFRCSCSRARVGAMLRMLGRAEVDSILHERGNIEVNCEFCNRRYEFDRIDAGELFATAIPAQPDATRH